jgi:hypothetical protein
VWIDHFRRGNATLRRLLDNGGASVHAAVIGELACGHLQRRGETLRLLRFLPQVARASDEEVLEVIERRRLFGSGLGWVDAHLVAAALLARGSLWTLDRPLQRAAIRLDVHYATAGLGGPGT